MPEKLRFAEKGLRGMGMGAQVDSFEHSMNAAAEGAAPGGQGHPDGSSAVHELCGMRGLL